MGPLRVEMLPMTPWRHYLAHHKESNALIGPGVRTFYAQFRTRNDANRARTQGNQLRLDFVVERIDGSISTLHPGRTPQFDATVHCYRPGEFQPQATFRLHDAVQLRRRPSCPVVHLSLLPRACNACKHGFSLGPVVLLSLLRPLRCLLTVLLLSLRLVHRYREPLLR